jgi:hypothetical protein
MKFRKPLIFILLLPLAACVQPDPDLMTGVPVAAPAPAPAVAPAPNAARAGAAPAPARTTPARGPVTIPEAPTYTGSDTPSDPVVIDLYD